MPVDIHVFAFCRTWKLEDVATREKWTQRFQSVQALDALSEAASFDGDNEQIRYVSRYVLA